MRIAYITAGAANMYCGSCIHDNTLAAAIQKLGHEVALIPMYTPLRTDEENVSLRQVFYGGLNIYLQQALPAYRYVPRIVRRVLDSPVLLSLVSRLHSRTDPKDLGALTVSVLRGERGSQRDELARLVEWLRDELRPDIVQLTNSMFVGFASELKRALGVPILCGAQGEDLFLQGLAEPYRSEATSVLQERASDVDGFIVMSRDYADFVTRRFCIPRNKVHVVPLGLKLDGHGLDSTSDGTRPFVVGYLARVCPEKGLHVLVEAFRIVAEELGPNAIRLEVAGYLSKRDRPYLRRLVAQIKAWGLMAGFEYCGEVDRNRKIRFLNGLDVLSVPTVYRDPKGLFVLEALANGVPVVQPRHGAFPELIAATGGGILVDPDSPAAVAEGILQLHGDPQYRRKLGRQGNEAVHRDFGDETMAEATVEVYRTYLDPPVDPVGGARSEAKGSGLT